MNEKLYYTAAEIAQMIGVGRTSAYELKECEALIEEAKESILRTDPGAVFISNGFAYMVHKETTIGYWLDILCMGDEADKRSLFLCRYDAELTKARETIRSLTDTIDSLKATIKNFEAFIENRGLEGLFEKFLHPEKESVLAKLAYFKSHAREQDVQPKKTVNKKHDMER